MDKIMITPEQFEALPSVAEGHSKEIRYAGDGLVYTRLKPTVYSYTHNRAGVVEGSDTARLRASKSLVDVVKQATSHAYCHVGPDFVLSKLVLPENTGKLTQEFTPTDMTDEEIEKLPRATPIETVVKKYHTGTPKHRYYGMDGAKTRTGESIRTDEPYPELLVRFDWRNPLEDHDGNRLADEVLPEHMADWFIDTKNARQTALDAFNAIDQALQPCGLELWDICFFITEDGSMIFSEISPDCMRVRSSETSYDKDVWRRGGSHETVIEKWNLFADLMEKEL